MLTTIKFKNCQTVDQVLSLNNHKLLPRWNTKQCYKVRMQKYVSTCLSHDMIMKVHQHIPSPIKFNFILCICNTCCPYLQLPSVTISDFNNQVRYSHIFPFPKIHHISIGGQYEIKSEFHSH